MITAPTPCTAIRTDVPMSVCSTFSAIAGTSAMNGAARNVLRHIAIALMRRPGLAAHEPETLDDRVEQLLVARVRAGLRQREREQHRDDREEAHCVDRLGPRVAADRDDDARRAPAPRPRLYCADESAIAPGRSSTGTRSGRIAWNAGKPSPAQMPLPKAMIVSTGADGWPITNNTVSSAASPVCTNVVAMSRSLRGSRSASAPPIGPKNAIGRNPAAAIVPVHAACPVCFGDVDAERDRLHPRADVGDERARPQARVGRMAERRDRVEARRTRGFGYRFRHCGARFSKNAHAFVRVGGLRVVDHHRLGDVVRGGLGQLVLGVEGALAEREHVRARHCHAFGERHHLVVEAIGRHDPVHESPVERGRGVDHLAREQHLQRALAADGARDREPSASSRTVRC